MSATDIGCHAERKTYLVCLHRPGEAPIPQSEILAEFQVFDDAMEFARMKGLVLEFIAGVDA